MNMIDVIKRLAELDAKNPHMVQESQQSEVAECGMMPMPGMSGSSTPASVNITAGSGQELSNMLKDIMSLAGVHQVEPHELGAEPAPVTLTAEPMTAMGPAASAGDEMRAVIDRINGDDAGGEDDKDDEEADEGAVPGVDNTPTGVDDVPSFKKDAMLDRGHMNQEPAGHPGVGDRNDGKQPRAFATMEESLMDEYRQFVAEDLSGDTFKKPEHLGADLVHVPMDKVAEFEDWMESEGLETNVPKQQHGSVVVYDYSNADHTSKMYADEWNDRGQNASEGSMDDTSRRIFKRNELQHELGHEVEPTKFAVAIDGRTWKTFDDRRQAENIARSLQAKGKKATVHSA